MKIAPNSELPFNRESRRPSANHGNGTPRAENPAPSSPVSRERAQPPGLSRTLSRLQGIPESERTAGQSNAITRISRNIARYVETAAIGASPTGGTNPPASGQADGVTTTTGAASPSDVTTGVIGVTPPASDGATASETMGSASRLS